MTTSTTPTTNHADTRLALRAELKAEGGMKGWRDIETAPETSNPILVAFTDEFMAKEENSFLAPCAVVRFQHKYDASWRVYSLAGPFGIGLEASQFKAWMPLADTPTPRAISLQRQINASKADQRKEGEG